MRGKVIVILGPTASGKSEVAIELAKKIGGEIVNADSRQIYKYIDVATAKPSKYQFLEVPHHLYDFLNPKKSYSAGEYARDAGKVISEILLRDHLPLIVGGTGFYIHALFDGLPQLPKRDSALRAKFLKIAKEKGKEELHNQLKKVDPISAKKIPYQNIQRVIRALEVYHLTQQPLSLFSQPQPSLLPLLRLPLSELKSYFFGLRWKRDTLKERIRIRTEKMFPTLIEETKELLKKGFTEKDPGLESVGTKETIQYLKGKISYPMLLSLVLQRTHQYAKRQMTYFKRDKRICWLDLEEPLDARMVAEQIIQRLEF